MPKKSTYFEIKERYPNKEIFRVDSEVLQDMLELPDDEFHKRRRRGGFGGGAHRNGGGSRGGRGRQDFTHQRELQPSGYYAIIEDKMGSFYGEIPGFTMLRAVACDSYDKCVEDLTEQLTQKLQFTAPAMWPAKKNYDEIQKLCGITRTVVQIVAKL